MDNATENVIDGRQLKAGRAILGLTIDEMAKTAGLHRNSVLRVERFTTLPRSTCAADQIQKAQESLGICFEIKDDQVGIFFPAVTKRTKTPYVRNVPTV